VTTGQPEPGVITTPLATQRQIDVIEEKQRSADASV
jgi:hypothetical protein